MIVINMAQNREKPLSQFLLSVNSLRECEVASPFVTVSSFFRSRSCGERQNKLVLKDNLLLVSTSEGEDHSFALGLPLQEGICFRRLTTEGGEAEEGRQLKGFRLFNAQGHYVDFLLAFESLARIWVDQLARLINEVGFCEHFEVLRKLGRGSTCCVYEVRRRCDQRLFAAKVVLKGYLRQREERGKALAQEIELLRAVDHENVIRFEGVFESEHAVYMVFQRLEGGTLLERINSHRGLSLQETRHVMRGIADGLAYLHRFGIAHRDLKLENILLRGGQIVQPVIADFGLAVLVEEQPYLFYRCGTPGYVAPEVMRMRENRPVRVACDVFSAGAILHVLLTNSYLFAAHSTEEVARLNCAAKLHLSGEKYDRLDPCALDLLRKMLTVRVGDRITAEQMLEEPFLAAEEGEGEECGSKESFSPAVTQAGESCLI